MNHNIATPAGTWREAVVAATDRLAETGIDGAEREVRWLLREVIGPDRPWLLVLDDRPDDSARAWFESMVQRREAGEPLQYVIGHWPFRSLDLLVDERALIPRPETEQVAEVALAELDRLGVDAPVVVDLGTGTGALALSIAVERPEASVLGVDASREALELAMENRDRVGLGVRRVALARGSWYSRMPEGLRGGVDLIVTNPPYVATNDEVDEAVLTWEPSRALFAGDDGLDDFREIIAGAPEWLAEHGVLVAEIGATQAEAVTTLARAPDFAEVEIRQDLAMRDRILIARCSSES